MERKRDLRIGNTVMVVVETPYYDVSTRIHRDVGCRDVARRVPTILNYQLSIFN